MTVVKLILQIVLVVLSLLLTLLILMHKGKGGGLSDMFGHHHCARTVHQVRCRLI